MKRFSFSLALASLALVALTACSSTWSGVKQDTKEITHSVGKGLEKAGDKIQDMTK
jgi:predicted small secreted protein